MYKASNAAPELTLAPFTNSGEISPATHVATREILEVEADGGSLALQRSLMEKVADIETMSWSDKMTVFRAAEVINIIHAGQKRSDGDKTHTAHAYRIVHKMLSLGVTDRDMLVAALLHDTVEDRPEVLITVLSDGEVSSHGMSEQAIRQEAFAQIGQEYGDEASGLVAELTNPIRDEVRFPGDEGKLLEYGIHLRGLLATGSPAVLIKILDQWDNYVLNWRTQKPERQLRSYQKYLGFTGDFIQAIGRVTRLNAALRQSLILEFQAGRRRAIDCIEAHEMLSVEQLVGARVLQRV